MISVVRGLLATALVALLAVALQAEEKKPVKADDKKPVKKAKDPNAGQFTFPKQIKLDDKQKEQIEKLQSEYSPKLTELAKKKSEVIPADRYKAANEARKKAYDAIMTPERLKEAKAARQKALDDGKGKKEAQQAYLEALKITSEEQKTLKGLNKLYEETLKMTDEEKKQLADIQQERSKLIKEITSKKMAILTDEQKEALKTKPKPKPKASTDK